MLRFRFDLQIEDGEVNGDSNDSNEEESSLNNVVTLPKLFAPFKDKSWGWTVKNVEQQALLYIKVLGYGNGGTNTIGRFQKAQSSKAKVVPKFCGV